MDFAAYQRLIEQNKHKSEDNVFARFYDRVVKTDEITKTGLPVFKTVCYCEIRIKDNTTEIYDQPATEEKYKRFPIEYAQYQLSRKKAEKGTPLEQFAFLTAAEIVSCKYRGIFTVEDLAALDIEHAKELGLIKESTQARLFMGKSSEIKQSIDAAQLIESYKNKIAELEAEIESLKKAKKGRKK